MGIFSLSFLLEWLQQNDLL